MASSTVKNPESFLPQVGIFSQFVDQTGFKFILADFYGNNLEFE